MHDKELWFIEAALLKQGVTIRRTTSGNWLAFRKGGRTMAILPTDAHLVELHGLLLGLARRGLIVWPPNW